MTKVELLLKVGKNLPTLVLQVHGPGATGASKIQASKSVQKATSV